MKDVVIVPTFDRPEFLWLCLENIAAADGWQDSVILVCEDIHADKPKSFTVEIEMLATIRYFEKVFGQNFRYRHMTPHTTYGNSLNLLRAFQESECCGYELICVVEDDVLVTKDFFLWNQRLFDLPLKPWVVCAGRLNRSLNFESNGRYAMDESIRDVMMCKSVVGAYNSWATCFPRSSVTSFLKEITCDTDFKPGVEQDMLIQDYMRKHKLSSAWPYVPRAFHVGWYSYHRNGGIIPQGTLEQRVSVLRSIVMKQSKLREIAGIQDVDAFQEHEAATALYLR